MIPIYRGRFAPSPTGPLHFGSLVAAVASYLEAKSHAGEWLVRMEDLDTPRVVPGAADGILRALEACGMQWDGAIVSQSKRADAYHAELHRLRASGLVYPCACSRREIADSALNGIEGPVYPGTCRNGLAPGKTVRAWRINTRGAEIGFDDAVQGACSTLSKPLSAISCCCAPTIFRRTSWRWWLTTLNKASPTSCAAPTCSTPHRARSICSSY